MGRKRQRLKTNKIEGSLRGEDVIAINEAFVRRYGNREMTTHDGRRDLAKVFGYTDKPTLNDYINRYNTQELAELVIDKYPQECWAELPEITDDEDTQDETGFDKAVKALFEKLKIRSVMERLDKVTGLGSYGGLFIGVLDGQSPEQELVNKSLSADKILFLNPLSEKTLKIQQFGDDPTSPRYRLPVLYSIQYREDTPTDGQNAFPINETTLVHWSRIIHVAENALECDYIGKPRMRSVYNLLTDVLKTVGSSAETFYLNARGALHMDQDPLSKMDDISKRALIDNMQNFTDDLTRFLLTKGIKVAPLNFNIADPSHNFDMLMSLLSAATGIPKRILMGSERGELASSQDEKNWAGRVNRRRRAFCEEEMLRPLLNWFIERGILPKPKGDRVIITWPEKKFTTELDESTIALNKAKAMNEYTNNPLNKEVMPAKQFAEEVLKEEYREDDIEEVHVDPNPQEDLAPLPAKQDASQKK